ncbi:MAG: NACHT domain-containing protein [Planctomycetota bacterium]
MLRVSGRKIKRILATKDMNGADLINRAGLHKDIVYGILAAPNGSSPRAERTAGVIARALDVEIEEILEDESIVVVPADPPEDELQAHIRSFDAFIDDRIRGFEGRNLIFREIRRFIENPKLTSGYFVVRGEPGIGKSSLAAKLVRDERLDIHHFNIALQGINTLPQFLANICARLIRKFKLPWTEFPNGFEENGSFLNEVLSCAATQCSRKNPLVIVVDALDEVATANDKRSNTLFLPPALPSNVFFVVTTRPLERLGVQAQQVQVFDLLPESNENRADVRAYVTNQSSSNSIRVWLRKKEMTKAAFVDVMLRKSAGNFMYIHHVLPAIARGDFDATKPDELPQGLRDYYRSHWEHMRGMDEDQFEAAFEPVVCILGAIKEAVSAQQVAEWTGVPLVRVRNAIAEWRQFLDEERVGRERRYRVYHLAFQEFLQEEVDPGLGRYNDMIAKSILAKAARALPTRGKRRPS